MEKSHVRYVILTIGLLLLGASGMHAQSIITPPSVRHAPHPIPNTHHAAPEPTVMPATEMYDKGYEYHTEGDYESALTWFRKAALQKNAMAQNTIGEYYEKGLGVEQDLEQAEIWYRKSADQGYEPAVRNLERLQHH